VRDRPQPSELKQRWAQHQLEVYFQKAQCSSAVVQKGNAFRSPEGSRALSLSRGHSLSRDQMQHQPQKRQHTHVIRQRQFARLRGHILCKNSSSRARGHQKEDSLAEQHP
jgi:hypothetical protein